MPHHDSGHVGAINLDFCEGPFSWCKHLTCFTVLGDILGIPDYSRLEETKLQDPKSEGSEADVASKKPLVDFNQQFSAFSLGDAFE